MIDSFGMDRSAPSKTQVNGKVKWFNPTKGFGFVQLDDGSPDAFLHISVLEQAGLRDLPEGAGIVCDISDGRKGPQVAMVHSVDTSIAAPQDSGYGGGGGGGGGGGETASVDGKVKFFNNEKGFGFITPDDGGKDVFVSLRTLERSGINGLQPEQRVRVETRMGQKGPMAESIELI